MPPRLTFAQFQQVRHHFMVQNTAAVCDDNLRNYLS